MASLLLLPLMDSIIGYMWTQGVRESIVFKYQAAVCAIFFTTALVTTALSWKQLVFLAGLVSVGASSVLINKIFLKSFVFNTYGFIGICGIAFAVSIYSLIKKSFLSKDFFNRSIFYASWLYPMSILLLYPFKIGNQSYFYGEGNVFNRGFMGFHPSSNEINAILIVMLGYALFRLYTHFNWHDFLAVFMNFYAAMLIQSRSSVILCTLLIVVYFIALLKDNHYKQALILLLGLTFCSLALIPSVCEFVSAQRIAFERSQTSGESFWQFITNGRIERIDQAKEVNGSAVEQEAPGSALYSAAKLLVGTAFGNVGKNMLAEMDFIDIYKGFGILGALLFTGFYSWFGIQTYLHQKHFIYVLGLLVVYAFSFATGHVLFCWSPVMWFSVFAIALIEQPAGQPPYYWKYLPTWLRRWMNAADIASC